NSKKSKSNSCECPVKVGDLVIYKKWGGNDVEIDDVEYQFLKFEDILAVVSKK
ncbi:MAG: co-chaperone GroES, partial [Candidatus Paceibacterota bacterium]